MAFERKMPPAGSDAGSEWDALAGRISTGRRILLTTVQVGRLSRSGAPPDAGLDPYGTQRRPS